MKDSNSANADKYASYSREELLAEIKRLKKSKKYGLVWEHKKEQVIEDFETQQPYLREVTEKRIENAPGEPTNLIIEGDNFEALSILNYTHAGKVDVIYIDPPYNTGNKDFIYNDDYVDSEDEFRHSKWLSFMEPRLKLAKNLLAKDGVIFISIDDNEQASLRMLCDEVFGRENNIDVAIWKKTENIKMDSKFLSQNKDYILMYRKSQSLQSFLKETSTTERFKLEDEKGKYYLRKLDSKSHTYTKGLDYVIEHDGIKYYAGGSKELWEERQKGNVATYAPRWLWSKKNYEEGLAKGEIVFKNGNVYNKVRFDGVAKKPFINIQTLVSQQTGQKELDSLFDGKRVFDHPKPTEVIEWLMKLVPNNKNASILDFFAGSGTTGHAVLELNKEDGGHRQFILCTNNGDKGPDSTKIAEEITYPRIKTVITGKRQDDSKYSDGIPANLRYYKIKHKEKKASIDANRLEIVRYLEDIIQVKENAFEQIEVNEDLALYKNNERFVGIVFEPFALEEIIESIKEKNDEDKPVKLYVFSYSRDAFEDNYETDFEIEFVAMPEGLLKTYANIVAETKKEDA